MLEGFSTGDRLLPPLSSRYYHSLACTGGLLSRQMTALEGTVICRSKAVLLWKQASSGKKVKAVKTQSLACQIPACSLRRISVIRCIPFLLHAQLMLFAPILSLPAFHILGAAVVVIPCSLVKQSWLFLSLLSQLWLKFLPLAFFLSCMVAVNPFSCICLFSSQTGTMQAVL